MNRRVRAIFTVIFVIVVLGGFLFINSLRKNPELDKNSSYLIIGKENLIAVYQDKLAVRIPYGINIDKDKIFKDLVDNKNEEEILKTVNKILPVPLNNYMRVKFGQVQLNVKNAKNIPETTVDNKRYIVTSSLHSMYETLYNEQKNFSKYFRFGLTFYPRLKIREIFRFFFFTGHRRKIRANLHKTASLLISGQ